MQIALFQPDIPQNTGTILRLCACLDVAAHITTKGATSYLDFAYGASDILLFGRETVGVTDAVAAAADARLKIPIKGGLRSLNVAMAAAMAAGEALRQTRQDAE